VDYPTGLRAVEPLKITSAMDSPRRCLAEHSPSAPHQSRWIYHTNQIRRHGNGDGIDKGFKTGNFNLAQTHFIGNSSLSDYMEKCEQGGTIPEPYRWHNID